MLTFNKSQSADTTPFTKSRSSAFSLVHSTHNWYSGGTPSSATKVSDPSDYYILAQLMRKDETSFHPTGDSVKIYGLCESKLFPFSKDSGDYRFYLRAISPNSKPAFFDASGSVRM